MSNNSDNLARITNFDGQLNRPESELIEQIKINIRKQLPQVQPHQTNQHELIFACGGPSLADNLDELKKKHEEGSKIVSVNNTHDWLIEHGLKPSVYITLDSRPENVEFVQNPIASCKYFVASQSHPSVVDALLGNETYIYHVNTDTDESKDVLNKYYRGHFIFIEGGTTVALRGMMLLRLLGFQYFHFYGFDSCWKEQAHHAYEQKLNDKDLRISVKCDGREFYCAPWMVKQAQDFMALIKHRGDLFKCNVVGDGLISHMIKTGAEAQQDKM